MNRQTATLLLIILAAIASQQTMAQKQFTLEDLNYGGTNYRNFVPQNCYTTWWGDRLIRQEADECSTIDKKSGRETRLFTLDEINAWCGTTQDNKVRSLYYAAFPYADKSLVAIDGKQWRYLVDWKKRAVAWKLNIECLAGAQASEWSTASRALAYVADHQLHVKTADGRDTLLTTDGSREIVYGQSVHRDEFGITKGLYFSPDGRKLAFYRMDQRMVADYPQVDIFGRIAVCEPDKYPMAGETSHRVTVEVYDLDTRRTVTLDAGDPTDRYFTNIAWSPDGRTLYLFELNRDQNDCRLVSYDALTGRSAGTIYREQHAKYVEPQHPIVFLPWASGTFVMQSQRDGYNHLYLCSADGRNLTQLTAGPWTVLQVLGFDSRSRSIIYTSTEQSALQTNTYAVDTRTGRRILLDNGRGYHTPSLSPSGAWLVDNYSEPDVPRRIEIVDTRTGYCAAYFDAPDPWQGYDAPRFECGTLKAADDTTDLYYRLVKPADFDPARRYPVVVYVYGGPHAHNVDARWHYAARGWEIYMAQRGYLIFVLDNRGSERRGRDFEQVTFRQLGQVEMQDQMRGVRYLRSLPYVDVDRIGVHGWSYGGFMTISLMTSYPETFKVGVAGGPVIDWKWYEVMYGERYMDTPQANPEGYRKTSLLPKAAHLKGKLQIIHGYNDPTVVLQHSLAFIAECVKAGTQPDLFLYPGEPHNMRGHQSVHLHERITQYFDDYLK